MGLILGFAALMVSLGMIIALVGVAIVQPAAGLATLVVGVVLWRWTGPEAPVRGPQDRSKRGTARGAADGG